MKVRYKDLVATERFSDLEKAAKAVDYSWEEDLRDRVRAVWGGCAESPTLYGARILNKFKVQTN